MLSRLRAVARLLGADDPLQVPWQQLRYQHFAVIRAQLLERGQSPATVNATLAVLRGTARQAYLLGLIPADHYQLLREVKTVKADKLPAGRAITPGELGALLDACANDPTAAGRRDAAIVALLYAAGLRRAELVGLNAEDYAPATGELKVLGGKGAKDRLLWVNNGAADALAEWLDVRGSAPGPLFLPINKGGRIGQRRMTGQAVQRLLEKRGQEAGLKGFSPHDPRRTLAREPLGAGAGIATVQWLAGHAGVTTTAHYCQWVEDVDCSLVGLLPVCSRCTSRRANRRLQLPARRHPEAMSQIQVAPGSNPGAPT